MSTQSLDISAGDFRTLFSTLISEAQLDALIQEFRRSPAGAPPRVAAPELVKGMVFHMMFAGGLLSTHIQQVTGQKIGDSSISQRREAMGAVLFQSLLDNVLGPIAQPEIHPHAFYNGLRLVGIDGSTFSVSNTPPIKASKRKTSTRRGSAAFFKLGMTALYELGTHNPLAAKIGLEGESEMALALPLIPAIQSDWLLIADRYYGVAKFLANLRSLPSRPKFVIRARDNLKCVLRQSLKDGSALIEIRDATTRKHILLREIRARIRCRSGRWMSVRLWTNLLDQKAFPAKELLKLYGMRWEHEIAYKQIKIHLRRSPLLLSHTVVSAAQEIGCLLLAQTIIARMRMKAAGKDCPLLQISFIQTLQLCRSFWFLASEFFSDIINPCQLPLILERILQSLQQQQSRRRRLRSCPRALRQPVSKWPRLRKNVYTRGAFQFKITRKSK
jgi:hypothetical protein